MCTGRHILAAFLFLCCFGTMQGRDFPRFTFGAEGAYAMSLLNFYHRNYIASEGDRINLKGVKVGFSDSGQILVHAGVNISAKFNLSLESGYCGIYGGERMVPLSLKGTWLSGKNPLKNRWLAFAAAGCGVVTSGNAGDFSGIARIGGGYRVSLNRFAKLDFIAALQCAYIHPETYRTDRGESISGDALRRNEVYVGALTFGIGLTF